MTGLLSSWSDCCAGERLDPEPCAQAGRALLARWREPHRRYHTVKHLTECLGGWQHALGQWRDPWLAGMALWYHDAVLDPLAGDNEARSADLARGELEGLGLSRDRVDQVAGLVLATDHRGDPGDPDARLLVEVDLAILGDDPARYDRYARDVRGEYAAIDDASWRHGRADVLRRFLARERIFRSPAFAHLEPVARSNLRRELAGLVD